MIKQDKIYIAKQKKKYLIRALIWAGVIIGLFIFGMILTKTKGNIFTVLSAVFTLGLAQNLTRYISFSRYKDPKEKHSSLLERMKGSLGIYHGAIIPDTTATVYFEHIVVTSRNIYFISSDKELVQKSKNWLANRLEKKGIDSSKVHFIIASDAKAIKNASLKIEKDACYTSGELEQNMKIIEGILM